MLTPEFQAVGARHRTARVPDPVTLEWLQEQCAQLERIFRLQFRDNDGNLDPRDEHAIARLKPPEDTTRALKLWALLKHLYMRRSERLVREVSSEEQAETVARQIMMREPVRVELRPGITADITGRSYAALLRMAEHDLRIRALRTDLEAIAESYGMWQARAAGSAAAARSRARRNMRRLETLHRDVALEMHAHRQMLYAHALTADGRPARGPEDAPAWWETIDELADAALLHGLFEVMVGRYVRLGEPPKPKHEHKPGEDFGYASLFSAFDRRARVEPASFYNRDLVQSLTWARAASDSIQDEAA